MLDLMVGDPHGIPHPIVWIGKLIGRLDASLLGEIPADKANPEKRDKASENRKGLLLVLIVIMLTASITVVIMYAAYRI